MHSHLRLLAVDWVEVKVIVSNGVSTQSNSPLSTGHLLINKFRVCFLTEVDDVSTVI